MISEDEKLDCDNMVSIVNEAINEALQGRAKWNACNSAHEAFAVMKEEVDELWDHVKQKQVNRDLEAMKREAMQVAAMAIRFAAEVCDERRGRR